MIDIEKVLEYNRELRSGLSEMFSMLPPGQQKQVLKNPEIKALLIRYHVIDGNGKDDI